MKTLLLLASLYWLGETPAEAQEEAEGSGFKVYDRRDVIYISNLDGSGERKLADGWSPGLSPSRTHIVYVRRGDLHLMDLETEEETLLLNTATMEGGSINAGAGYPRWHPDGRTIFFDFGSANLLDLWMVEKDGTNPRELIEQGSLARAWPSPFSPDGRKFLYDDCFDECYTLLVFDLDTVTGSSSTTSPSRVPNDDYALGGQILPSTVEPDTWGGIKGRMSYHGWLLAAVLLVAGGPATLAALIAWSRLRVRNLLFSIVALAAVGGADMAVAQNRANFVVDGDPMDWRGVCCYDEYADVVPDTNSTVDVIGYEFGGAGRVFNVSDTLFTFIFGFGAPPFQGPEETTVEIFFDMSQSDTYGVAQGPWRDFRPDYVVGVTGSNGALTKEFYWRWTGSAWDKKEGADIPEVDVAFASTRYTNFELGYLEGAWDWKLLDIPDTDRHHLEVESYNQLKAVRVSKGEFRDYVPNDDYALGGQILPSTVEPDTWGGIKGR